MENYLSYKYSQTDIDNFLSAYTEESINLDFKRGVALAMDENAKKEIVKDVSAFANSDGGIIIYGIDEIDHKAGRLCFVDGSIITKEWLEQVINSRIQRKISGLIIDVVRYENDIAKSIFVIKIPRSIQAPHRTSDKRFYKRYNFMSVEMEEYEIRDLYSRKEKTSLKLLPPEKEVIHLHPHEGFVQSCGFWVHFKVENVGNIIETLYKLEIQIPSFSTDELKHMDYYKKYFSRYEGDYSIFSIPNKAPIFQNEIIIMEKFYFTGSAKKFKIINYIILTLYFSFGTDLLYVNLDENLVYNKEKVVFETVDL
ncbi:hypothetical protein BH10BAC5_BH10BAC5_23960 [soil metagenome]